MVQLDNIEIIGAGPAGLYSAILLKSLMPATRVHIREQNSADATFGFGVVFSDQALDFLRADDPQTHQLITPSMEHWRDMKLSLEGESVLLDGIGFSAIGRLQLLQLLQRRAGELGVEMDFGQAITSIGAVESDADLVIGADGLNSLLRRSYQSDFSPVTGQFNNHFAWFGTPRGFDTLTQTFIRGQQGVLNAHHYRYAPSMSTFIVECDDESYRAYGFDEMDESRSAATCEELFSEVLQGSPLLTNRSGWRCFPRVWCENWVLGKRVIIGDAAHSAHFSIGSGTRLALEDAIALVQALRENRELEAALDDFQRKRLPVARKIVDAANHSALWYDDFGRRMALPPMDFAFDYLTRSGRIDKPRLRKLAPRFMARYDQQRQAD